MFVALSCLLLWTSGTLARHIHGKAHQLRSVASKDDAYSSSLAGIHSGQVLPFPSQDGQPFYPTNTSGPQANTTCSYWLEDINHHGKAPYQSNSSYQVFRNVMDYGAKGNGITDDTAAINLAISSGTRCAPGSCNSTTTSPALVYFPAGTYVISSPIIDFYYTQLIGNPNCLPRLLASSNFTGIALVDGDPYGANGLSYGSTNTFWRQVRNFVFDMTKIPANKSATGIHWPTAQATSLQNLVFLMSDTNGTRHQGVFVEEGSGGFMTDLVFNGGLYGANWGNQQFTTRNLSFSNAVTAINQLWNWGWTYKGISINNCSIGINMSAVSATGQTVGSITLFDSSISNTPIGLLTAHDNTSTPPTGGSLILENIQLNNVPVAVQGPEGIALVGTTGATKISAWGQGHGYLPNGPVIFENPIASNSRPASLLDDGNFYQKSKPQYEAYSASSILSVRSFGASGDGFTDDTNSLQQAIYAAVAQRKILFVDAGYYKITSTLYFPPGSKVVGEAYPVILGSGSYFSDINNPQVLVQIGHSGEKGTVEWLDMIVSTQAATAGALLIEWNLDSSETPIRPRDQAPQAQHSNWPFDPDRSGCSRPVSPPNPNNWPVPDFGSWPPPHASSFPNPSGPPNPFTPPSSWHTSLSSPSVSSTWTTSVSENPVGPTIPPSPPPPQSIGPSGMWDVHIRVGGFTGSNLQYEQCASTPQSVIPPDPINTNCIAAFMSMHITSSASNLYMENTWLWTADHDIDDGLQRQITIYNGRGLYIDSTSGPIWLYGTSVEHHTLYQYQLYNVGDIFMGQIQTETAYYQPNPPVLYPFSSQNKYNDPDFSTQCTAITGFNFTNSTSFSNDCSGLGLRIADTTNQTSQSNILIYGAGLYSFFDNYNTSCSTPGGIEGCQSRIFTVDLPATNSSTSVSIYNLNTVGSQSMITLNQENIAKYDDNVNNFADTIALFRV